MMGLIHGTRNISFTWKRVPKEWAGLKSHELVLLAGIFSNGAQTEVELSSLQNEFYTKLPGIKNGIFDELMEHGYFQHRPDYVLQRLCPLLYRPAVFFFWRALCSQKTGSGGVCHFL